jgi:hypothetical protein
MNTEVIKAEFTMNISNFIQILLNNIHPITSGILPKFQPAKTDSCFINNAGPDTNNIESEIETTRVRKTKY